MLKTIIIIGLCMLLIGCTIPEPDYIIIFSNDTNNQPFLQDIDCMDVIYNEGKGVSYGNVTLIQELCMYQEINRLYDELQERK